MKDPRKNDQQRLEAGPDGFRFVEDAGLGLVHEDFGKKALTKEGSTDDSDDSDE